MAEIITIILGLLDAPAKIKQYVFDPIKTQFSYVRHYSDIMERLRVKNQELNSTRDHLRQQIQAAKDNLHNIVPRVENWCTRVDQRKEVLDRILADEPRVQNDTCLQGTCSSLKMRYSRSRVAKKLTAEIVELLKDYNEFRGQISDPAPRMGVETILVTSDTLEFDSRKQKEEEIMSCLRDHSICMIGVWGMGGVGKTVMTKKIGGRASKENLFDRILMAVVSQRVDLLEIQGQLAQGLGLHLTEEAVTMRATKLYTRLMKEKVLIILDDVWKPLNLEQLGIPSQTKLLLTTRDRGVCRSMSKEEATRIVDLRYLNEEEAFFLFCKNVGHVVVQANLRPLAMNVARECKGLPLALVIVGRTLTEVSDESIWQASLRQLQRSAPADIDGYFEGVYRPLELSYNNLKGEEDKSLFLLCCLFPEDSRIGIENLVRYGVGLANFSATESISEVRDRVNLKVRNLVARCLLMDAGDESCQTYVKMHDVIRDMALSIASRGEHKFMVRHGMGLREWPRESYTCISLTLGEAMTFQEGMHCQGLKALLLTFDLSTRTPMLPENFLKGMADLTLLSIDGQHWSSERVFRLPLLFLSSLTKLRVLHLRKCGLEDTDISLLCQVKDLEILSCRGSDIQELPDEIRALRKLKLLDMTDCTKLKNIAPGVIPALVNLEELRLMGCPIEWERQETGDERRNASLAEVFSLKSLSFLEIWIKDLKAISEEMNYSLKLTSYSIAIGRHGGAFDMAGSYTDLKRISVHVGERRVFPDAISKLIEDAKEVKLKGNGCKVIIELLGRGGFENVRSLEIDELGDVKILVEPTMGRGIFPIIRHLKLSNMNDLEEICNGHPSGRSFSELEKITIKSCAKLKCVFPLSIAESLSKLERLEVWYCPVVEEVFNKSESGTTTVNHVKFPNLKVMALQKLPRLGAWCKTVDAVIEFPSIETLEIYEVSPNFKDFGNMQLTQVTCTKLRDLTISHLGVEIFYPEIQPIGFFSGLESLHFKSFHGLRTLFSWTVLRALSNLCQLIVEDCMMLEEIIEMKKDEDEGDRNNISKLSRLRSLRLSNLPKIRHFGHFSHTLELSSLQDVKIVNCPKMEAFVEDELWCSTSMSSGSITARNFFNKQVTCPKLRNLYLKGLNISGLLFSFETPISSLGALFSLDIINCHNLESLFTSRMFEGLANLFSMEVRNCSLFNEVIAKDENEDVDKMVVGIPNLVNLYLIDLPKLHVFSHTHSDLELPGLTNISLSGCTEIINNSFCLGGGSVHMANGATVEGISDPKFASQFFFPTQKSLDIMQHAPEEDSLDNGSFMLFQSDISFTWDSDEEPSVVKGTSNAFFVHGWKKACGKFDMEKLSSEITYEIAFVIMLIETWIDDDRFETMLADEKREYKVKDMPKRQWMEILVGELRPSSGQCGDITFSLQNKYYTAPVVLKCASIRPKRIPSDAM